MTDNVGWKTIGNYRQWEMTDNGNDRQWGILVKWHWQTMGRPGEWQTMENYLQWK